MDQNDKKSMEYKLGSFLRKLRSGDPDAYQTFRKSVFYGILLVAVVLLMYQPIIQQGKVYRVMWTEVLESGEQVPRAVGTMRPDVEYNLLEIKFGWKPDPLLPSDMPQRSETYPKIKSQPVISQSGIQTNTDWCFVWERNEYPYADVVVFPENPDSPVLSWETDWEKLAFIEAVTIALAFIFLGITKKN